MIKSAGGLLSEKSAGGRLQMAYVGGGVLSYRDYTVWGGLRYGYKRYIETISDN